MPLLYRVLCPYSSSPTNPSYPIPVEASWRSYVGGLALTAVIELTAVTLPIASLDVTLSCVSPVSSSDEESSGGEHKKSSPEAFFLREARKRKTSRRRAAPPDLRSDQLFENLFFEDYGSEDSAEAAWFSDSTLGTEVMLRTKLRIGHYTAPPLGYFVALRVPIVTLNPMQLTLLADRSECRLLLAEIAEVETVDRRLVYQVEEHNGAYIQPPVCRPAPMRPELVPSQGAKALRAVLPHLTNYLSNEDRVKLCLVSRRIQDAMLSLHSRQQSPTTDLLAEVGIRAPPELAVCLRPDRIFWWPIERGRNGCGVEGGIICLSEPQPALWGQRLIHTMIPPAKRTRIVADDLVTKTRINLKYRSERFNSQEVEFITQGGCKLSWAPGSRLVSWRDWVMGSNDTQATVPVTNVTETSTLG